MRYIQLIQIGDNVTDILKLPCVTAVFKENDKRGFEWLEYNLTNGEVAEKGDWLCEDCNGGWHVLSDEEYNEIRHL